MKRTLSSRILVVLALVLFGFAAASPLLAIDPPSELPIFFMPSAGWAPAGTPVQATVLMRTRFLPVPQVERVERQQNDINVFLSNPAATEPTDYFYTSLSTDLPALEPGTYQVRYFFGDQPSSFAFAHGVFVVNPTSGSLKLDSGPNPTSEDELVLRLTPKPCSPNAIRISKGDGRIRLHSDGCFVRNDTTGMTIPLGRLAAGKWKADVETYGLLYELSFEVKAVPGAESTPVVLAGSFEVAVTWRNAAGESGSGKLVQAPSQDSALFYFFSPDNWELMVKVLDGCAINGHYWVFGAASTDVAYDIGITRRGSTQTFTVTNPLGNAAEAITEIEAFPCDPAAPQG